MTDSLRSRRLWRGLCIVAVGGVTGCLLVVLALAWWLSSHYQPLLTQSLSTLLGAEVRVAGSALSFRRGLGVGLERLVVQNRSEAAPFFSAERVDVLLDLRALLRGQLLFHYIHCLRPRIRLTAGDGAAAVPPLVVGALLGHTPNIQAEHGRLSPQLAVRRLVLHDSQLRYDDPAQDADLVVMGADLDLSYGDAGDLDARLQFGLGADEELGQVSLQARLAGWRSDAGLEQLEWNGTAQLRNLGLNQTGRWLGRRWPQATLDFTGRWTGRGTRRFELAGEAEVNDMPLGAGWLGYGKATLTRLVWQAPDRISAQAELLDGRAEGGPLPLPVVIHSGSLDLDQDQLALSEVRVGVGSSSIGLRGRIAQILSAQPRADLWLDAEIDLADGLAPLLALGTGIEPAQLARQVQNARGQARVQLRLQGPPAGLSYAGHVRLRQAAFSLPDWHADISGLDGTLYVDPARLTTDELVWQIGRSSFQARGWMADYLSAHRTAELYVTLPKAHDRDVASFLPSGTLLDAGGTLSGHIEAFLSAGQLHTEGELRLRRVMLDPVSFLRPLEVDRGWLRWRGQQGRFHKGKRENTTISEDITLTFDKGKRDNSTLSKDITLTFDISQGRWGGGSLTGQGRFTSLDPPHVELTARLTDLDLEMALALDRLQPGAGIPGTVVRTELQADRLRYKALQAHDLRLDCHWHDRQADLTLAGAQLAGGRVEGQVVLWPDRQAMLVTPRLTEVDTSRFLQDIGRPSGVLTGALSGTGRIAIADWQRWDRLVDWDASLSLVLRDGVIQRLPVLVRLWSALSLQGLLSFELPSLGSGLAFSSLGGDLTIDQGRLRTDNLVLDSSAVRFDTSGSLDLTPLTLDLTTALVPLHGITSSVAKVPLAGELLARGADRLTTLSFRVTGPLANPTVAPSLVR